MSNQSIKMDIFYLYFHTMILMLVIGGFGINAIVNREELPPASFLVFIHGIILGSWYLLVILQAWLIKTNKYFLHSNFGKASLLLAIGIIVTGVLMTLDSYNRSGSISVVTVNLIQLINFVLFFSLALYQRKAPAQHKRYILLVSISILLPALSRIVSILEMPDYFALFLLILLLVIMVIYDIKTLTKVHWVTRFGIVIILFGIICTGELIASEDWANWFKSILMN